MVTKPSPHPNTPEKWFNYLQTFKTRIRRRILRHLICGCIVCQLPFKGSPDYNGLSLRVATPVVRKDGYDVIKNKYVTLTAQYINL